MTSAVARASESAARPTGTTRRSWISPSGHRPGAAAIFTATRLHA